MLFTDAQPEPTVAVVGAGAVGGVVAGALHEAGHPVYLCVRTPFDELRILTGAAERRVPARIVTRPAQVRPVRWVLLAVKAFDIRGTAPWLAALCDEHTTVVVLRNGVDHTEDVRDLVPAETTVVPALVYIQAERLAPGRVRLGYGNSFEVAAGEEAGRLAELFRGSTMAVRPQEDLVTAAWLKLMLNAAVNPLTALTLRRMEVFRERPIRDLALGLMREVAAVGAASGARLTEEDVQRTLAFTADFAEGNGTSMLYDRLTGRPVEYEALTGAVVRHAEAHGIEVPLNRAVMTLLAVLGPLNAALDGGIRAEAS
ncbi:2-dehydropantoate 2-reductase [Streptomyces sp. NRRL S-340]|uniref:2-dehydropantoate 2-reductase n=1 Tax=Streptomyces sp. NRRL S-340 TaxID=1463901 RepID=UPI00068AACC0|nr:2-dehydropantoate 2-reductase [Streptomyces sp. NRRL S-340]